MISINKLDVKATSKNEEKLVHRSTIDEVPKFL